MQSSSEAIASTTQRPRSTLVSPDVRNPVSDQNAPSSRVTGLYLSASPGRRPKRRRSFPLTAAKTGQKRSQAHPPNSPTLVLNNVFSNLCYQRHQVVSKVVTDNQTRIFPTHRYHNFPRTHGDRPRPSPTSPTLSQRLKDTFPTQIHSDITSCLKHLFDASLQVTYTRTLTARLTEW